MANDIIGWKALYEIFCKDTKGNRFFSTGVMDKYWNWRADNYEQKCDDMVIILDEMLGASEE